MHYRELLKEYIQKPIIKKMTASAPIVEFDIYDGFDDKSPHDTITNLIDIYSDVLCTDPNWHFFNEGDFMVVRCTNTFAKRVKQYLDDKGFAKYKGPRDWVESTPVTKSFQYRFFAQAFHLISEGVITLMMDKEVRNNNYDYCVKWMLERIIHAWFNHNLMPSIVFGKYIKEPISCQMWESQIVSDLALLRAKYAGTYEFFRDRELKKRCEKNEEVSSEKA